MIPGGTGPPGPRTWPTWPPSGRGTSHWDWAWVKRLPVDQGDKSRMTGDRHVRICGSPGGEISPGHPTKAEGASKGGTEAINPNGGRKLGWRGDGHFA